MRILFCRWHSICEPDILGAWKELGYHVDELCGPPVNLDYDKEYLSKVSDLLMGGNYDIVFSINFIPIVARVCQVFKIRYVSYTVDCPVVQLYSDTLCSEWNRLFIFDGDMCRQFQYKNPSNIFHLPLAGNSKHMDSVCKGITKQDRQKYSSDVSFIGSLYTEKSPYNKLKLPDKLKGYFDGAIEAQLKIYGYNFLSEVLSDDIVEEFKKCAGIGSPSLDYQVDYREFIAQEFLGVKCSELERIRFLNELAKDYRIALYTQSDISTVPKHICKGRAESRIEMPKIFHLSKINLNFTLKSIRSGISQRIWDVLAAGGFLITNYQTELSDYFEIGKDLDVFENLDDLKSKIAFYLEHEDIRREIAGNGQECVRRYHTYEERIKAIEAVLNGMVT